MKLRIRKRWACVLLLVASPVLVPLLFLVGSGAMAGIYWVGGYYVNIPGWRMGVIGAEKGSVDECEKLRKTWYFGGFDSGDMHRSECIHRYAKITHDPSACELLMPSEYGWSCLGAATEKQPCLFDFAQEPEVRGNGIIALMKECLDGSADIQNNSCCIMARTVFLEENFDCALLKELPAFEDQCLRETALKRREPDTCASISNGNIRSSCEVGVRALLRK